MEVDEQPQLSQSSNASLDVSSPEFAQTVREIASAFGILPHPRDALITLRTVEKRLADLNEATNKVEKSSHQNVVALDQLEIGAPSTGSNALDNALRVLRLLHGARLRGLQTQINSTIGQIQQLTANPRADLSLGQIGR